MHGAGISEHPSPLEADLSAALFGGCAFRQSRSRNSGTQKTRKMADKLAQTRPINDIGRLRVNGGLVFVCLHQSRIHPGAESRSLLKRDAVEGCAQLAPQRTLRLRG